MVGNKAFQTKWTQKLRKVRKFTSDPCTDQEGEEIPLSKTVTIITKMKGEALQP